MSRGIDYKKSGVCYDLMDPFKRAAQKAAATTAGNIERFGFREASWTRGESVYLIETPQCYLAIVEEGLGTKNKVADLFDGQLQVAKIVSRKTRVTYYNQIAQCGVAMIVNDMCTLGATPLSTAMHLAVGDSGWFKDKKRWSDLIRGWTEACNLARCTFGPGETPTLKGLIHPDASVLSGSSIGIIRDKYQLIKGNVRDGDAIVIVESSGLHANGYTLARKIADKVPGGYLARMDDNRFYGEGLLEPTIIYPPLVEDCLNMDVDIHYTVNITGHGWRKLMRLDKPFTYVIDKIPNPHPVFRFIQEHGPVSDRDAYKDLNMGAGFALYVPQSHARKVIALADRLGMRAMVAGHIEKSRDKKVVIKPLKNMVFKGKTLAVR